MKAQYHFAINRIVYIIKKKSKDNLTRCNSYFNNSAVAPESVGVYKDQIYTVAVSEQNEGQNAIWQVASDGSLRKELIALQEGESFVYNLAVHRGYLYYTSVQSDKDGKVWTSLYRYMLGSSKSDAEQLCSVEGQGAQDLLCVGKYVYFSVEKDNFDFSVMQYNLADKQGKLLFENDAASCARLYGCGKINY